MRKELGMNPEKQTVEGITGQLEKELDNIKDEMPRMPLEEMVNLAKERVTERTMRYIDTIANRRIGQHQEAVNKAFYG